MTTSRTRRQRVLTIALASALTLSWGTAVAGPIKARQNVQDARIDRGVSSGNLTKGEQAGLRGQQHAIDKGRDRALANDGKIGKKEAKKLTKAQNRASRDIHAAKHNKRTK